MPNIDLTFPLGGVDRRGPIAGQPPNTTPLALNVRPDQTGTQRERGGARPALRRTEWIWPESAPESSIVQLMADVHRITAPDIVEAGSINDDFPTPPSGQRVVGWSAPRQQITPAVSHITNDLSVNTVAMRDENLIWWDEGTMFRNGAIALDPMEPYIVTLNVMVPRHLDGQRGYVWGFCYGKLVWRDCWRGRGGQETFEAHGDLDNTMTIEFEWTEYEQEDHDIVITPFYKPRGGARTAFGGSNKLAYDLDYAGHNIYWTFIIRVSPPGEGESEWSYDLEMVQTGGGQPDKHINPTTVRLDGFNQTPSDDGAELGEPRRVGVTLGKDPEALDGFRHAPEISSLSVEYTASSNYRRVKDDRSVLVAAKNGELYRQQSGSDLLYHMPFEQERSGAYIPLPLFDTLDSADRLSDLFVPAGELMYKEDAITQGVTFHIQGGDPPQALIVFEGVIKDSRNWHDVIRGGFLEPKKGSIVVVKEREDGAGTEPRNLGSWAVEDAGYLTDKGGSYEGDLRGYVQVRSFKDAEGGSFAVDTRDSGLPVPAEIWTAPRVAHVGEDLVTTWTTDRYEDGFPKGHVPYGCSIAQRYRDRIVLAGSKEDPTNWFMSRAGDPYDFDYYPLNAEQDTERAVSGQSTEAGRVGEPVTALISYTDDYMLIGCVKSLWKVIGDPAYGGQVDNLSHVIGITSNTSWCHGPSGEVIWLSRDGVYMLPPGAAAYPESVSREKVPRELVGIDPATTYVTMQYDAKNRGVLISLMDASLGTYGDSTGWWFDWETKTWWPESYLGRRGIVLMTHRDENQTKSGLLWADTAIWRFDDLSGAFNPAEIPFVVLGPVILSGDSRLDGVLTELFLEAGLDSGGSVDYYIYTGQTAAEAFGNVLNGVHSYKGLWHFGAGYVQRPRVRGHVAYIKVGGGPFSRDFSIETLQLKAEPAGLKRVL